MSVQDMKRNWALGILVGVALLGAAATAAGVICAYLTEYGERRMIAAAAVAALGVGASFAGYILASKHCTSRKRTVATLSLLLALLLAPLASMVYPGMVTYSRFGLTVYGIIPVPVLDVTVGSHGGLWFRDKSHYVSIDELRPLLSPDVEVVVIGIGWHSAVDVDPAIRQMEGLEVHLLPTPAAFALFNRCVLEGRPAVLIAHSTC